jgi:hypothetical protein
MQWHPSARLRNPASRQQSWAWGSLSSPQLMGPVKAAQGGCLSCRQACHRLQQRAQNSRASSGQGAGVTWCFEVMYACGANNTGRHMILSHVVLFAAVLGLLPPSPV